MSDLLTIISNGKFNRLKHPKIAFVQPPYPHGFMSEDHGRKNYSSLLPNLGMLQIIAYLRKQKITNQMEYFESAAYADFEQLEKVIKDFFGDDQGILAVSAYTRTISETIAIFKRWNDQEVLKVVGGPHVTCLPDTSFAHIVVRGEGEETLVNIIKDFPNLSQIKSGIAYVLNGQEVITPPRYNQYLDNIPLPEYKAIKKYQQQRLYKPSIERELGGDSLIYMSSQGCKGFCSFCPTNILHGCYRYKTTEKTIEELNQLVESSSSRIIEFHDDDFLQRPDFDQIALFLNSKGIKWSCFARVDSINKDKVKKMVECGCKRVFLGIESGYQKNLNYFFKKTTIKDNQKALKICQKCRLATEIGIILGTPHDTLKSIIKTFEFIKKNPIRFCSISILTITPGTLEWRRALKNNLLKSNLFMTAEDDGLEPRGVPTVCTDLTKQQLNWLVDIGYALFYLRPSQIIKNFTEANSMTETYALLNLLKEIYENLLRITLINKRDEVVEYAQQVLNLIDPGWFHTQRLVCGPDFLIFEYPSTTQTLG